MNLTAFFACISVVVAWKKGKEIGLSVIGLQRMKFVIIYINCQLSLNFGFTLMPMCVSTVYSFPKFCEKNTGILLG